MKFDDYRTSDNVEDQRGDSTGGGIDIGSIAGSGGKLGLGVVVVVFLISQFTGIDFRTLLGGAQTITQGTHQQAALPRASTPNASDPTAQFVSKILAQTEDTWKRILPEQKNVAYQVPKLVLFRGQTQSGCGSAQSAMGPFYCPNDRRVYLDTAFFDEMKTRLGGGGEFPEAYVIAHEIGHHVQNLLGILPKVNELEQQASSKAQANGLSVRLELMADCLAGVWAANDEQMKKIIEPGDIDKALATASAIGDDRLQQAAGRAVVPDSFTHGSSAQRQKWLTAGLKSGQVNACNTFAQ